MSQVTIHVKGVFDPKTARAGMGVVVARKGEDDRIFSFASPDAPLGSTACELWAIGVALERLFFGGNVQPYEPVRLLTDSRESIAIIRYAVRILAEPNCPAPAKKVVSWIRHSPGVAKIKTMVPRYSDLTIALAPSNSIALAAARRAMAEQRMERT